MFPVRDGDIAFIGPLMKVVALAESTFGYCATPTAIAREQK